MFGLYSIGTNSALKVGLVPMKTTKTWQEKVFIFDDSIELGPSVETRAPKY